MSEASKPFGITISASAERKLRAVMAERRMSMRGLMSAITEWFASLDRTEQALVLGQVEDEDVPARVGEFVHLTRSNNSGAYRRGAAIPCRAIRASIRFRRPLRQRRRIQTRPPKPSFASGANSNRGRSSSAAWPVAK